MFLLAALLLAPTHQELRKEAGLYSFQMMELKAPKDTVNIKFFFEGKEIKLKELVVTKDKYVEIKVTWEVGAKSFETLIETDLFEDGWTTKLHSEITKLEIPY